MIQETLPSPIKAREAKDMCPVKVYTEWQPLEEVIVGDICKARVPDWHVSVSEVIPFKYHSFFQSNSGKMFPEEQLSLARKELECFAVFLDKQGIRVRRPSVGIPDVPFSTPFFCSSGNLYYAMPRDCLFAIGNMIIETPMAWRNRYFETFPFREIIQDYFCSGARWLAAPKPMLSDDLYRKNHSPDAERFESVVLEVEPVFDAADFVRLGRDIVGQLSHVTNWLGIEWLKQALGPDYKVHIYQFDEPHPMHIDTTLLPMCPGKLLVNPDWVTKVPSIFSDWQILTPPRSNLSDQHPLYFSSKWISMNILMLDERHVLVEVDELPLREALKSWGFEPIPIPFKHFQSFGGSFHCATLDTSRRGKLETYL